MTNRPTPRCHQGSPGTRIPVGFEPAGHIPNLTDVREAHTHVPANCLLTSRRNSRLIEGSDRPQPAVGRFTA